jgi:citrate synthase
MSWLTAEEAARTLGVSRATLYAYVSRGYIRSQPAAGMARDRRYSREDVERLRRRTEQRRDPDKAAAHALQWGMPILESSIALIDGRSLYYRGHDAVELSRSRSVAEVASLIWTGRFDTAFEAEPIPRSKSGSPDDAELPFVARAQALLAHASSRDLSASDLRAESVALSGWKILNILIRAAAPRPARPDPDPSRTRPRSGRTSLTVRRLRREGQLDGKHALEHALAQAWGVGPRGADVLRAALILCADHELNVSAFTARCVASAGSNPYAVVIAGLAALAGTRHGGVSARVEATLESMRGGLNIRAAVGERLRRGEAIDGFGHPLYRAGDPRAAALLQLIGERYRASAELAFVAEFAGAAASALREQPTVDFALAALARVLKLPPGSPLALFAIGRTIGWIGHAIEQYATGLLIRPRAKYVGPPTTGSGSGTSPGRRPS